MFDENGDGKISKRELVRAYRIAGFNPTNQEVDALIKQHDLNGNHCRAERGGQGVVGENQNLLMFS